jgi:GNAT superfamily N-acetyltransferase
VPEALVEFATRFRQPAAPGIEILETPRYRITLQPDYPIAGPNSVAWVRCGEGEVADLVREVRAIVAPRRLPLMWVLDPDTEPADLGERLVTHDITFESDADVMVLPVDAHIEAARDDGIEIRDALGGAEAFRQADAVNADAFGNAARDPAAQERRRVNQLAAGNRRVLLATVDGEPAASAGITLFAPHGAILNGGGVRARFRGRGLYRALVAERLRIARQAGVPGVQVWGGYMSAPILRRLGFETVSRRRFYRDLSTGS